MADIEYKRFGDSRLELKSDTEAGAHIRAYVCAFGNIDSYGDIIDSKACDAFLADKANADRMALCYQHDIQRVIGVITDKGVDDYGLWIEADIVPTTEGKDIALLLKAGALREFSIGYYANEYHYEMRDDMEVRILDRISIVESSIVTRAANPKAGVTDVKNEDTKETQEEKTDNTKNDNTMEETKQTIEQLQNELKMANDKLQATEKVNDELKQSVEALDKSAKAQADELKAIKDTINSKKKMNVKTAFAAMFGEKKAAIENFVKSANGGDKMSLEVKLSTPTNNVVAGTSLDLEVAETPMPAFAFLNNMRRASVNGKSLTWIDGTYTDNAAYVAELANAPASAATAVEKHRQFGKLACYVAVSSEVTDFIPTLYNWVVNEGTNAIMAKVDDLAYSGAGDDTSKPNEIYGLKGQATAFAALGKYGTGATVADVILDAAMQIGAAGKNADQAYVSWKTYAELKGIKDANGNPIFDAINGMLGGVKVIPSAKVANTELLVMDSSCADLVMAPVYELEIERSPLNDSYNVFLRRRAQVKVKEANKVGIVKVAAISTAITAIQ